MNIQLDRFIQIIVPHNKLLVVRRMVYYLLELNNNLIKHHNYAQLGLSMIQVKEDTQMEIWVLCAAKNFKIILMLMSPQMKIAIITKSNWKVMIYIIKINLVSLLHLRLIVHHDINAFKTEITEKHKLHSLTNMMKKRISIQTTAIMLDFHLTQKLKR